jgi:hypothetical protein
MHCLSFTFLLTSAHFFHTAGAVACWAAGAVWRAHQRAVAPVAAAGDNRHFQPESGIHLRVIIARTLSIHMHSSHHARPNT